MSQDHPESPEKQQSIRRRTFLKRGTAIAVSLTVVDLMPIQAARHDDLNCHPPHPQGYHQADEGCSSGLESGPAYEKDESCGAVAEDHDAACNAPIPGKPGVFDEDGSCGKGGASSGTLDAEDESCRLTVPNSNGGTKTDTDESVKKG